MFLTHVTDNRLIKIVSRNFDGCTDHGASQGNNGNIRCSAADVNNHISARLGDIDACPDRCRNRFLDNGNLSCACLVGGILNRFLLHLGNTAGNAYRNARFPEGFLPQSLLDEIFHHFLGYCII